MQRCSGFKATIYIMIKPIHSDDDYQSALKRAESFWGFKQDTPEGDGYVDKL